jgi:hypothetical protein
MGIIYRDHSWGLFIGIIKLELLNGTIRDYKWIIEVKKCP